MDVESVTARPTLNGQRRALLALLLLVPAPSIGALSAIVLWPGSPVGSAIFLAMKLWLFGLPAVWHLLVDGQRLSFSPPRQGGFVLGAVSGVVISIAIVLAYYTLGPALLDLAVLREKVAEIGLGSPGLFAAGAAYWILVNSVLEEYVWRWFCYSKCRTLMPRGVALVVASLFFTLHHVIALQSYLPPVGAVVCSAGVFIGGAFWCWMYDRYRSIWPAYLSHAIVDLAAFAIAAEILFGE